MQCIVQAIIMITELTRYVMLKLSPLNPLHRALLRRCWLGINFSCTNIYFVFLHQALIPIIFITTLLILIFCIFLFLLLLLGRQLSKKPKAPSFQIRSDAIWHCIILFHLNSHRLMVSDYEHPSIHPCLFAPRNKSYNANKTEKPDRKVNEWRSQHDVILSRWRPCRHLPESH